MTKVKEVEKQNYEKIPLTWDFAFKNLFGRYGNEDILKKFLSAVLKKNITNVVIQNGELPKDAKDKKLGILDIRAEIDGEELVDIELQMQNERNITERILFYLAKLYSSQINENEEYGKMKKTIVIALLNFSYYNRPEFHATAHMKFDENNCKEEQLEEELQGVKQELLTDKIEVHIIDLKKFSKIKDTKGELADWLNLILGREEMLEMAKKENKEINKAIKVVEEMGEDAETRELYRLIQKGRIEENTRISNAKQEGETIGETRGRKLREIEIAKEMLKEKMDIETIIRITKLTKKEVEKLK